MKTREIEKYNLYLLFDHAIADGPDSLARGCVHSFQELQTTSASPASADEVLGGKPCEQRVTNRGHALPTSGGDWKGCPGLKRKSYSYIKS